MNPSATPRREPGPDFPLIETKALPELVSIIPAPDELQDLRREKEQQAEWIKKIVKEASHSGRIDFDIAMGALKKQDLGCAIRLGASNIPQVVRRQLFRRSLF